MKKSIPIALAAAVLLSGAAAASANTMSRSANTMATPAKASDTLKLSGAQQKTAWQDLTTPLLSQSVPSGFNPTLGGKLPKSVTTAPMPPKAASDVPALKPYAFAMVEKKLVIINPADQKIVDVITG